MIKFIRLIALVTFIAVISAGCSDSSLPKKLTVQENQSAISGVDAAKSVHKLKESLDNEGLLNARLIKKYAIYLSKTNPDLKPIVDEISKESSVEGATFKGLQKRLADNVQLLTKTNAGIKSSGKDDEDYKKYINQHILVIQSEFDAILGATQTETYNLVLSDYVNMLADMADDKLPRVDGKKPSEFYKETGAKNTGAATALVGNENYGSWVSKSDGTSFWEFYGQYSMMRDVLSMGSNSYSSWNSHRPYSYYNDYYGSRYSSSYHRNQRTNLSKTYKSSTPTPSSKYIKQNPSVSKKFTKLDNQFVAKKPGSRVVSSKSSAFKSSASKSTQTKNGSKWGSQYSSTKPSSYNKSGSVKSSSTSRSSRSGK